MSLCSAWVHDPAQGLAAPPPNPDELAEAYNDFVQWIWALKKRRSKQGLPKLDLIKGQSG